MSDEPTTRDTSRVDAPGERDASPELPDRVELELRERLTVLEAHSAGVDAAIGLIGLGVLALAVGYGLLVIVVRRLQAAAP